MQWVDCSRRAARLTRREPARWWLPSLKHKTILHNSCEISALYTGGKERLLMMLSCWKYLNKLNDVHTIIQLVFAVHTFYAILYYSAYLFSWFLNPFLFVFILSFRRLCTKYISFRCVTLGKIFLVLIIIICYAQPIRGKPRFCTSTFLWQFSVLMPYAWPTRWLFPSPHRNHSSHRSTLC